MNLSERAEACLAARRPDEALALFDRVLADAPDDIDALIGRGRALNNLRRHDEAEAAFRTALARAPGDARLHNFLGHVLRAAGRAEEALQQFRAAVAAQPDLPVAHYNVGTVLAGQGDYAAAVEAFQRSITLGTETPAVLLNLAELNQFRERFGAAEEILQRLTRNFPDLAEGWEALAEFRYSLGSVEAAGVAYDRALALDPASPVALAGRALLHELWGDIDDGLSLLAGKPDHSLVVHARARLLRRKGEQARALELLRPLAKRDDDLARDPRLYFSMGEMLDELGRYDEAFAAFDHANAIKPAPFDPAAQDRHIGQLSDRFDAAWFADAAKARAGGPCPVFIVGMPRSGTSLVEQILATHGQVHAGGERLEVPQIVRGLGGAFESLDAGACQALRQRYLDSCGAVDASVSHWTDKLPKNFLNLGLIAVLFPDARVIWCQRDARDTGLSVYFQNMNFRSDPWTSRLEHIACYSRGCTRLMEHWRQVLPLPVLPVRYEALIDQPEQHIRALLDFLELPWEPACLEFHRTRRLVNTASYAQVRKPIYRSSVGRWKHYEKHLGPLATLEAD